MGYALTISWDGRRSRVTMGMLVGLALAMSVTAGVAERASSLSVIVREDAGAGDAPERAVAAVGGSIGRQIGIIDGFVATVPADRLGDLRRVDAVHSVTPNGRVQLLHNVDGYNAAEDAGSMFSSAKSVKADMAWAAGYTGQGVDVALVDSGVVPVNGLTAPGKVINGPDLSFESQAAHLTSLDTFGHGTHMAGIIAGRDDGKTPNQGDHDSFMGIAPGARVLNLKVANALGAADVSQVIAAIDWVVQHKNDNGMNVRVMNLSFGTDGVQDYQLDPLTYAAEVAWHNGIVVVVAAGNAGFGSSKLNNPAYDPYVVAVGASDTKGTYDTSDDVTPEWTSRGDGTRNPDLVAPGKSIVSLRSPESYADQTYPTGRVGSRYFRGSGTSQSAAMVSGAAAVLVQKHPNATPDQIKKLLMDTASPLPVADPVAQGEGVLNMKEAIRAPLPQHTQTWPPATGLGSLEAARGSGHVTDEGGELGGEIDIFGTPWDAQSWSRQSWSRQSWSGGTWMGNDWTGIGWTRQSWSGAAWERQSWSRQSWSGMDWTRQSWSADVWDRQSWSAQSWSRQSWSGQSWSAQSWSRQSWSRQSWSSASWGGDPVSTTSLASGSGSVGSPPPAPSLEQAVDPAVEPSAAAPRGTEAAVAAEPGTDEQAVGEG